MLFQSRFHDPIRRGEITCTVRIWHQPRVKVGKRYALFPGSIEVERIEEIGFESLTPALARRTGFASLVDLLKVAKHGAGERVFLIDFRYVEGPPKEATSSSRVPDADERTELAQKLDAMDRRAGTPWTRATLQAIAAHPGRRAGDLAVKLGRERLEFKKDVRKLKALGLTISLEVGYRLSPRGAAFLTAEPKAGPSVKKVSKKK